MECSVFFGEGEDGPIASEPLFVRVTLLSKLKDFALWVILLPLLLLPENRSRKALWILVPYYFWMGLGALAMALAGPYGMGTLTGVAVPLLVFLGAIFLLGERLRKRNGWLVFLAAILFHALILGIWTWTGAAESAAYVAVASSVLLLLVLVSLALARLFCRRRYGGVKLSLFLLLVVLLVFLVVLACIAIPLFLFHGSSAGVFGGWLKMLLGLFASILAIGFAVYLVLLSFLVVPLSTEFYRSRLCGLLKLGRSVPTVIPLPRPPVAQP